MDNTNEIADEMSEGRDVGGAVPYKRDRIVFLFCHTMVVIVDLFLRRANDVRPYRFVAVILCILPVFYSVFKLQTRCRKCFSVRSEPLIVFT